MTGFQRTHISDADAAELAALRAEFPDYRIFLTSGGRWQACWGTTAAWELAGAGARIREGMTGPGAADADTAAELADKLRRR